MREELLVRTLVELADNLVEDFDLIETLNLLCSRCVELFDVAAAGVMLSAPSGLLHVVASSSDNMRVLELFELQADEGPCVDSYRSGKPIINQDMAKWPRFGPQAIAAGFHSVHALPLRLRGRTLGALNMFRMNTGLIDGADVSAAQALADVAIITIMQHQATADAVLLNDQLTIAINSRVVIEQAKGRVSESAGVSTDEAFQRIRRYARNHNLRLTDLCHDISLGRLNARSLA